MSPIGSRQADPPAPLLEAQRLCKNFGGVGAVQDVSLAIVERTVFAIIGPNGAGKSTLLNLLSGLHFAAAVPISWCSIPGRRAPLSRRRA
jgi:ABC-type branched-subunit amino acid transport system ATPase component